MPNWDEKSVSLSIHWVVRRNSENTQPKNTDDEIFLIKKVMTVKKESLPF